MGRGTGTHSSRVRRDSERSRFQRLGFCLGMSNLSGAPQVWHLGHPGRSGGKHFNREGRGRRVNEGKPKKRNKTWNLCWGGTFECIFSKCGEAKALVLNWLPEDHGASQWQEGNKNPGASTSGSRLFPPH